MSYRKKLQSTVIEAALKRAIELYSSNDRVVVGFSGGKDSGICVEICRIAAQITRRQPVELFMLDDEIMLPGTFEYAERLAAQPDISMFWVSAREPMAAVWNRQNPYWWVFDEKLDPDQWVRKPPASMIYTDSLNLYDIINPISFPTKEGKKLYTVVGNRVEESLARTMAIHSTSSYITGATKTGAYKAFIIYDWGVGDVWKAIAENKWDYNSAYDVMFKMGMKAKDQRIAPPTMTFYGMKILQLAAKAWPKWFDKVETRVPGAKAIAYYGLRAVMPIRKMNESWQDCYKRECIRDAPAWIAERSVKAMKFVLELHKRHSNAPLPEADTCIGCGANNTGSWRGLSLLMYTGDPYSLKANFLPYVQPQVFRPEDTRIWDASPVAFR